jgi:hypothetical protein
MNLFKTFFVYSKELLITIFMRALKLISVNTNYSVGIAQTDNTFWVAA